MQAMNQIEALIEISRHYGSDPAYVIAGGGNTSYKDADHIWIKASGISLANIDSHGFVCLSRAKLGVMENKTYSEDPVLRELEVLSDLSHAIISTQELRPSVETSLHNLIEYTYIVHTHPTLVNAMMCARDSKKEVEKRFGNRALYVAYTDPGYILFKKLQDRIGIFRAKHGEAPKIIFLQNHGVFVGANSTDEIKAIYDSINLKIKAGKNLAVPSGEVQEFTSEASRYVAKFFSERNIKSKAFRSKLTDHFTHSQSRYQKVSRPFTPDIIVYCKSNYLFMEKEVAGEQARLKLDQFEQLHGYFPKVILEERGGLIIVEDNDSSLQTVLEVFTNLMKISFLSENFGGPHFMTGEKIRFIDNWEVEHYRRKMDKKSGS